MKNILVFILLLSSLLAIGQASNEYVNKWGGEHFLSVNPVNSAFLQQAGVQYEYIPGRFGFAFEAGGIYANKKNYSRIFMAATTCYGAFEFYSGYYVRPQLNFYMTKANNERIQTQYFLQAEFVYKHLAVDTTKSHVWYNREGADMATYRKQTDDVDIFGAFIGPGFKHRIGHFYWEFACALGWMNILQKMNVFMVYDDGAVMNDYPYYDELSRNHQTVSIDIRLGYMF